jgi:hypothetical protein
MKKQVHLSIRAHLKQTAFYLLLLLALCAIPFALAQRDAPSQSVAKLGSTSKGLVKVGNALPANIIVVTNTNDSGPGSLRQALVDANDGDTIDFDSSLNGQTITLTSGQLVLDKSVTISGPGANLLAVDGNANDRIFSINPGSNPGETVIISGLTIRNGHAVTGNDGGGILNVSATLTVIGCILSGNSGNGVLSVGGGIANEAFELTNATLTVTNCTVGDNSAGSGGGISNSAAAGGVTLTVTNSTITGNSSILSCGDGGGGIASGAGKIGGATITISNSTISGNSATTSGGGIENFGELTVTNSTISDNTAANPGGAIYNFFTAQIGDTVLNAGASGGTIFNNGGTVTSLGYNLASDDGGGVLTGPGDQINTDPVLGPLQDNGGPTFTHALLPGSPAIDTGDPNFTPPPFFDQRGSRYRRVFNGRIRHRFI